MAAVLYLAGHWSSALPDVQVGQGTEAVSSPRRRRVTLALQSVLIAVVPFLAALPWQCVGDDRQAGDLILAQALFRQKLLPFDDPRLGEHAAAYRRAVDESRFQGNFYSGMRLDLLIDLWAKTSPAFAGKCRGVFWEAVWRHPGRYLDGVGRTFALFWGARGDMSEAEGVRDTVLSPIRIAAQKSNALAGGAPGVWEPYRDAFWQSASPSATMWLLWGLAPVYGYLLPAVMTLSLVGLAIGLVRREWPLFCLVAIPWAALAPYLLTLSSIDRYAIPAQAVLFTVSPAVLVLVWRAVRHRRARTLGT